MGKHIIFTYGTVKRGEPNHNRLFKNSSGQYEFIGDGITSDRYPLVLATIANVPFLLAEKGKGEVSHCIVRSSFITSSNQSLSLSSVAAYSRGIVCSRWRYARSDG